MRRQRTALACAMLLLCLLGAERAFAGFPISWNGYEMVEDINVSFQSIAGGTSPLTAGAISSSNATPGSGFFPVPLPFPFKFLGTTYFPITDTLWVSINGAAKFAHGSTSINNNAPSSLSTPSYDLSYPPIGSAQELIMPLWGKFKTAGNGGIYTKVEDLTPNDPLGSRVLTVEWQVYEQRPDNPPPGPIIFQLRLYKETNIIEFRYATPGLTFYHPSTPNLGMLYGAAVGIKNQGQPTPCSMIPITDVNSSLLITPETSMGNGFNVRLSQPTHAVSTGGCGTLTGDNWAELNSSIPAATFSSPPSYSTSFHYAVPSIGYRIKPIIADIGGDTNGTGSRVCNIYKRLDTLFMNGSFLNHGTRTAYAVPVRAQLLSYKPSDKLRPDTLVAESGVIDSIRPGERITMRIGKQPIIVDTIGNYWVEYWCDLPGDTNRLNDTVRYGIQVGGRNDAMACCINSPKLNIGGAPMRYAIYKPIAVSAGFFNAGSNDLATLPVRAVISDGTGTTFPPMDTTLSSMKSGEERMVQFRSWTPTKPGLYYITASTRLSGDDRPTNDVLDSYPYATPGSRTLAGPLPRIPFMVAYAVDLSFTGGRAPGPATIAPGGTFEITTALSNNGAYDQRNVRVYARIVQRETKQMIYETSTTVDQITAGAQQTVHLGVARIETEGAYDLILSMSPTGNVVEANNHLTSSILCVKRRADHRSRGSISDGASR